MVKGKEKVLGSLVIHLNHLIMSNKSSVSQSWCDNILIFKMATDNQETNQRGASVVGLDSKQDDFLSFLMKNGMILSLIGIVHGILLISFGAELDKEVKRVTIIGVLFIAEIAVLITFGVILLLISLGWLWFNYKLWKSRNKIESLKTLKSIYSTLEGETIKLLFGILMLGLFGIGIWISVSTSSATGFFSFLLYVIIVVLGILSFQGYVMVYDS